MGVFSRLGEWIFGPPAKPRGFIRAKPNFERYPEVSGVSMLPRKGSYDSWKQGGKLPEKVSPPYIQTLSVWTVDSVVSAINEHERGQMQRSGLLWRWMLRDPDLITVMNVRCSGLPSLPFDVQPISDNPTPEEQLAAKEMKEAWKSSFPDDLLRAILRIAVGMGVVVGHIKWVPGKFGYWWPTLTLWPEESIRYDDAFQCWYALTREGGEEKVTPGDGHWFLWEPDGERGWQLGAVMSLALPTLITQLDWQDWVNYNDAHGRVIRKVIIPRGATPGEVNTFLANVKALGRATYSILCRRQLNPDDVFDFQFVTPDGDVVDTFERSIVMAGKAKAKVILGQTLTTDAATSGNRALGEIHNQIRNQILSADAEGLSTAIRSQILRWWAVYNLGASSLAPRPHWEATPAADLNALAQTQKAIGDSLTSLRNGLKGTGLKLKVKEWALSFKMPVEPGEDANVPAPTPIGPPTRSEEPKKLAA